MFAISCGEKLVYEFYGSFLVFYFYNLVVLCIDHGFGYRCYLNWHDLSAIFTNLSFTSLLSAVY